MTCFIFPDVASAWGYQRAQKCVSLHKYVGILCVYVCVYLGLGLCLYVVMNRKSIYA